MSRNLVEALYGFPCVDKRPKERKVPGVPSSDYVEEATWSSLNVFWGLFGFPSARRLRKENDRAFSVTHPANVYMPPPKPFVMSSPNRGRASQEKRLLPSGARHALNPPASERQYCLKF
eukprot:8310728-Pyramimonas_sp.AAC.1